jgi:AcrR family transcriptional regulator
VWPSRRPASSALHRAAIDVGAMSWRSLRRSTRELDVLLSVLLPVMLMLLFVHVFGGALGLAVGGTAYVDYVVPGVVLLCAGYGAAQCRPGVGSAVPTCSPSRLTISRGPTQSLLTARATDGMILTVLVKPKRDRQAERREATRRDILDSAWAVAHEEGLAGVTVREVADRVGMRAPSLYTHFESKHAIYDVMFAQAWTDCLEVVEAARRRAPRDTRAALRLAARTFFDFAVSDLPRHQLMNLRTVPGFEPSPASYAPSVATMEVLRDLFAQHGVTDQADIDLYVALVGGLVDSQHANDPGGDRWSRLLDRAVDMFVDHLALPANQPSDPREEQP